MDNKNYTITVAYHGCAEEILIDTRKISDQAKASLADAQYWVEKHNQEIKDWIEQDQTKRHVLTIFEREGDINFSKARVDDLQNIAKHLNKTMPSLFRQFAPDSL